jgi:hypothetical protein
LEFSGKKNLTTRDFLMVGFQLEKKIMPFFLKKNVFGGAVHLAHSLEGQLM